MSILDNNMEDNLDRTVNVLDQLRFQFKLPTCKVILEDKAGAVGSIGHQDNFVVDSSLVPEGELYRYFDLSTVEKGDYQRILKILAQEAEGLAGVVFCNIDAIPRVADKSELEYLVRFALKGDTLPSPLAPADEIDFGPMKVVALCRAIPQFVQLDGVYIIEADNIEV